MNEGFFTRDGLSGRKVLILAHKGADIDAMASAASVFLSFSPFCRPTIGVPDHISRPALNVVKKFSLRYTINPNVSDFDALILVDLNSWKMLGSLAEQVRDFTGELLVIDHHEKSFDAIVNEDCPLLDENAVSCTQLIYKFLQKTGLDITPTITSLLALGLIADSGHFLYADKDSFSLMAKLLEKADMKYKDMLSMLLVETDHGEKIAMLKAAKRVRIFGYGPAIIAISNVGSFEADSATVLVKVGADVSFVAAEYDKEQETIVSSRASYQFCKNHGFDIVKDVFEPLHEFFEGDGGGHQRAAAFTAKTLDSTKVLEKCVELTVKSLEGKIDGKKKEYT